MPRIARGKTGRHTANPAPGAADRRHRSIRPQQNRRRPPGLLADKRIGM